LNHPSSIVTPACGPVPQACLKSVCLKRMRRDPPTRTRPYCDKANLAGSIPPVNAAIVAHETQKTTPPEDKT
jgi:hypothetical protein